MTTPQQQPALHWWRTDPAFAQASATEIMEQGLEIGHEDLSANVVDAATGKTLFPPILSTSSPLIERASSRTNSASRRKRFCRASQRFLQARRRRGEGQCR